MSVGARRADGGAVGWARGDAGHCPTSDVATTSTTTRPGTPAGNCLGPPPPTGPAESGRPEEPRRGPGGRRQKRKVGLPFRGGGAHSRSLPARKFFNKTNKAEEIRLVLCHRKCGQIPIHEPFRVCFPLGSRRTDAGPDPSPSKAARRRCAGTERGRVSAGNPRPTPRAEKSRGAGGAPGRQRPPRAKPEGNDLVPRRKRPT